MHELVDEFSGLLAYRAVGVDMNVGGLGKIRYTAEARGMDRGRSAGSVVRWGGHFLAAVRDVAGGRGGGEWISS